MGELGCVSFWCAQVFTHCVLICQFSTTLWTDVNTFPMTDIMLAKLKLIFIIIIIIKADLELRSFVWFCIQMFSEFGLAEF